MIDPFSRMKGVKQVKTTLKLMISHRCLCALKKAVIVLLTSFSELELYTDVGIHDTRKSGSLYDKVRKNWAEKFSSVENQKLTSNESSTGLTVNRTNSRLSIGWALNKGRTGGVRFSENVRWCLTTRFEMGERTGKKANPEEIEHRMRSTPVPR